jgi:glycosyltransferase EpsJ
VVYTNSSDFRKDAHRLFDKNLLYTPWNKLFRANYILENNIRFKKTLWDDFPFNLDVLRDIERVTVTSKQYYHFIRKRAESETAAYRPNMYEKREEEHGWMLDTYKHWGVDSPEAKEFLARRYIERFIGCIENLTNPKCTLSTKEKRAKIKEMLNNGTTYNAVRTAKPHSKYMKIMLIPIKMNNVTLTLLEGKAISFIKCRSTKIFARLKANR